MSTDQTIKLRRITPQLSDLLPGSSFASSRKLKKEAVLRWVSFYTIDLSHERDILDWPQYLVVLPLNLSHGRRLNDAWLLERGVVSEMPIDYSINGSDFQVSTKD